MAAMRVVPACEEIEHRHAGRDLGFETLAVEQLALEGSEKTRAHGVSAAITRRAHRGPHAGLLTAFTESQ